MESLAVPLRLGHPVIRSQLLRPLALDMHPGEAHDIGSAPVTHRPPWLHIVPIFLEETGKLQLSRPAFALGGSTRHLYIPPKHAS